MRRFFRNIPWRNVLIITLTVVLGIGAIAGIASIAKKDTKTISATYFKRGAIDSNGFYIESDTSIYTKDLIECQGLKIEADFEATGSYQVFYYDNNKQFIAATEVLDCQSNVLYSKGETYAFAKYFRVVITPETPRDDYGNTIKDYKIKFYEVAGIANKFTITISENQTMSFEHLENYATKFAVKENTIYTADSGNLPEYKDATGMSTTSIVSTTVGSDKIGLVFDKIPANCTYIITNSANNVLTTGTLDVSDRVVVFQMPANGALLILNFDNGCAPAVYNAK